MIRWDAVAVAAALLLAIVAATAPLQTLFSRWLKFDEAYSHGLFVLGITLFLLYRVLRDRHFLLAPSISGIILAGLTATAIAMADVINIQILQQMGAVFLWWAIIAAMLGWRAALHCLIPVGFLYYAVPFWDYLAMPLQLLAVVINDALLGLLGIHFRVDGVFIQLLDIGTFEVAHGCSGLRYLVVALTLATLFSALNLSRVRDWVLLHAVAIGLALLVNWVRIFVIILVGYESRMESALIHQHELFGWILFLFALAPFFYIANRLANNAPPPRPPERDARVTSGSGTRSQVGIGLAVLVAVVIGPVIYLAGPKAATETAELQPPMRLGTLERQPLPRPNVWSPIMHRVDQVVNETYQQADGAVLDLGIWYYASQRQGHELVQYGNRIHDPTEWRIEQRQAAPGGWSMAVLSNRYFSDHRVIATSYYVAGRWASSELAVKAHLLRGAFTGRRDGALVALTMRCPEASCDESKADLLRLLAEQELPGTIGTIF